MIGHRQVLGVVRVVTHVADVVLPPMSADGRVPLDNLIGRVVEGQGRLLWKKCRIVGEVEHQRPRCSVKAHRAGSCSQRIRTTTPSAPGGPPRRRSLAQERPASRQLQQRKICASSLFREPPKVPSLQHKGSSGDSRLARRDEDHNAGDEDPEPDCGQSQHRDGKRGYSDYKTDIGKPAR